MLILDQSGEIRMKLDKAERRDKKRFKDKYAPTRGGLPLGIPKYIRILKQGEKKNSIEK